MLIEQGLARRPPGVVLEVDIVIKCYSWVMEQQYRKQLDRVHKLFPTSAGQVKVLEGGDDFLILEVNSGWMVRFPRNEATRTAFQREIQFLTRFKDLSPLPVPDYRHVGGDFGAYPKIQGRPLSFELFQAFSDEKRQAIGRQLASFLSAIHNFPLDEARKIGVTAAWDGAHQAAGDHFLKHVAPLLSPTARRNAVACMEAVFAAGFARRVIHGDFYLPDHVFYNRRNDELGVIDFADVTIYDPAHDFQCILEIGGRSFFEFVLGHYQGQADPDLLRRSELRLAARPLFVSGNAFARGLTDQYDARLARVESMFG